MKQLRFVLVGVALVLVGSITVSSAAVIAVGDAKPALEITEPNKLQENNQITHVVNVTTNGATINKIKFDILPLGGKPVFGGAVPLPGGRGFTRLIDTKAQLAEKDGVIIAGGIAARPLPEGRYIMYVVVTYGGAKTIVGSREIDVVGKKPVFPMGTINQAATFSKGMVFAHTIKVSGKYTAPANGIHIDKKSIKITLIGPDGVQVEKAAASGTRMETEFNHTFKIKSPGTYTYYSEGQVEGTVRKQITPHGPIFTTKGEITVELK